MDEQALNELLECSVCLEQLDHTSKVLPCQHTFCKRCLMEIVSTKQELRCPECRSLVEIQVDDLPTNILLVRLLEGLKSQNRIFTGGKRTSIKRQKKEGSPQATATQLGQQPPIQGAGSSIPCAKALFNYDAKDPNDLTFKKGDIVNILRKIDENWFDGEVNGQHGFFPVNYVQIITPLPTTVPQCKALYDFEIEDDKEEDCLTFRKDEVLTIIKQVDDNWLEGRKGDKIGIFPISFVEVNEPGKILLRLKNSQSDQVANKERPKTPAHPKSVKKDDINSTAHTTLANEQKASPLEKQQKRHSLPNVQDLSNHSSVVSGQAPEIPLTSKDESVNQDTRNNSGTGQPYGTDQGRAAPPLYMAMYNYKPQRPDEIELCKGDIYCVTEKCQDGWFKGQSLKDGVNGVFPGNYVQSVRSHSSVNKAPDMTKGPPSVKPKAHPPARPPEQAPSRPPALASQKQKSSPSRGTGSDSTKPGSSYDMSKTGDRGDFGSAAVALGNSKEVLQAPGLTGASAGAKSSAISNPPMSKDNSPILTTSKTTRYVRASKSLNPNTASMASAKETTDVGNTSLTGSVGSTSPIWKHSLSASGQITPPNVALGVKGKVESVPVAGTSSAQQHAGVEKEKKEKKEKEKLGLVKRLTSAGKSKKTKTSDIDVSSLSDSSVVHTRSSSYSNEVRHSSSNGCHKKSGSFDSTMQQLPKPSRPKPVIREKFRCIETYPSQSELELDLKIGDIIYVHKKRDDGWYKGTLKRSGKTGLFPGSFTEPCDQSK